MPHRLRPLVLSLLSATLLSLSWYFGLSPLIFIGFVPLLIIEDKLSHEEKTHTLKLFGLTYLAFFLWNIGVTWWVVYASVGGACMAFVFNSLFMALVFLIFSAMKKKISKPWADWLLIPLWIAYEFGHTLWDLTWTWLTLGNVFSFHPYWIQWYEFTGTSGGTLWILFINILIFRILRNLMSGAGSGAGWLKIAGGIIVPVFISHLILLVRQPQNTSAKPVKIVIVQPNVDPYNDKFVLDFQSQFLKALNLLRQSNVDMADYVVFPETFITGNLNEENISSCQEINWFRDSLIKKYPQLKIITGANTYKIYGMGETPPATARKDDRGFYYDVFNTALYISSDTLQIYHKSKLVPGVERMPFPALLKPLEKLAINMGGTMGSLGTQPERTLFEEKNNPVKIAPVICYESIFANYMTEYVRLGANLIVVITNDGWWNNTPGYTQHLNYGRLRAIENRREMVRCANTGISCFVDQFGNMKEETPWWKEAVISKNLYPNNSLTFFSRFGDVISYASVFICAFVFLVLVQKRLKPKY